MKTPSAARKVQQWRRVLGCGSATRSAKGVEEEEREVEGQEGEEGEGQHHAGSQQRALGRLARLLVEVLWGIGEGMEMHLGFRSRSKSCIRV